VGECCLFRVVRASSTGRRILKNGIEERGKDKQEGQEGGGEGGRDRKYFARAYRLLISEPIVSQEAYIHCFMKHAT
jgi:hypothetical protein